MQAEDCSNADRAAKERQEQRVALAKKIAGIAAIYAIEKVNEQYLGAPALSVSSYFSLPSRYLVY